ncbi:ion channel [Gilvibacter sediminis]|uniref:ion channel n=1 Tax=Gilvibacter sediminis TaxID=379071 RepID=UPI002350A3DD|nr:ion channel [Gilvibacter sediminis]MDC7999151.1 ion channel [Gilvibacter sediminis]
MLDRFYNIRFELFLFSQVAILFGSLIMPQQPFDRFIAPLLLMLNLLTGLVLVSKKGRYFWFFVLLLLISSGLFGVDSLFEVDSANLKIVRIGCYFVFYTLVALEIIRQVWVAKQVNKNVIYGLVSGYISLGLIGCFIFVLIEWLNPGSFQGDMMVEAISNGRELIEPLMYFSYITLMTVGYGDMLPATALAQKAVILVGLMGQFYLVIITAVVVGKYISTEKRIESE